MTVETVEPPGIATPDAPGVETAMPWGLPPLSADGFSSLFPVTPDTKKASGKRGLVVNKAMEYLGVPYHYGGTTPSGFDCSGLLQFAFGQFGMSIPRVSNDQANFGARVPLSELKPGDLVATDNSVRNNGADHIAMYAGNGWIIEAPKTGLNVRRRKMLSDEGWYGVSLAALYGEGS